MTTLLVSPTAYQLAARAGRGDLRALETFMRSTADSIANISNVTLTAMQSVTPGTGAASKALILGASGNVAMPAGGQFEMSSVVLAAAGAGSDASDAAVVVAQVNSVTGANGTVGVALPAAAAGLLVYIANTSTSAVLKVWPVAAGNNGINALGTNAVFAMGPGKACWFVATSATQWYAPDAERNTSSLTESNLATGSSAANATASANAVLDANKALRTTANVGAANAGTTAIEYGDGYNHTTVLTVATTLGSIAGGASLALGKLLYTLPAGACIIDAAYMSMAITQSQGHINANTPDVGIGTVIASGAAADISAGGTFENIIDGLAAANCTGTATVKTAIPTAAVPFVVETGAAHTIHFNAAAAWAASGDAAAAIAGTVVLCWKFMH